jgi:glycosyltransferase involved in cell wall biosynthesis
MLRIAVVIPNRNKCAPNDIAISQVLTLREMGYCVDLISLRNKGADYKIDGLNILNFMTQKGAIAFFRAGTYFLHMFLPSVISLFVKKSLCYVHSDIKPDCIDQYGAFKGKVVHAIWKLALQKSSKVAVVSSYLKEKSQISEYLAAKKLMLVPTTTQHPKIYSLDDKIKLASVADSVQNFRSQHKKIFFVVGSFRKIKNQQFVIDLIVEAKNNSISMGVIFFGDGEMMLDVQNKSMIKNVSSHCLFLGHVDFPNLYISKDDIMLSTSISEGFPLSFIEARDNGIPVLALDIPNLRNSPSYVHLFRDEISFITLVENEEISRHFESDFTLKDACNQLIASLRD